MLQEDERHCQGAGGVAYAEGGHTPQPPRLAATRVTYREFPNP